MPADPVVVYNPGDDVNDLVDALPDGGVLLGMPNSLIEFPTNLILSKSLSIIGMGCRSTGLRFTGATGPMIQTVNGSAVDYLTIENCIIDQAAGSEASYAVQVKSGQRITLRNCFCNLLVPFTQAMFGFGTDGVASNILIDNCKFYAGDQAGRCICIDMRQGHTLVVTGASMFSGWPIAIRLGQDETVYGACINQTRFETFGPIGAPGYAGGANDVCIDAVACSGLDITGTNFEANGAGTGGEEQLAVLLKLVKGAQIQGYFCGNGISRRMIYAGANAKGISVVGSPFMRVNGYGIDKAATATISLPTDANYSEAPTLGILNPADLATREDS